jgi:2,3-bisphosphoglycerate-dependent phosphoglycerate mutase
MTGRGEVPGDPMATSASPHGVLVLLRHGQSTWNAENRFTGWTDVDLSDVGVAEAHTAASLLREHGVSYDVAFTSVLKRAIRTLWIVQDEMDRMWVPVHRSWRLNERHYGALQGLDKAETAARLGSAQVQRWRRSYRSRPPALEPGDRRCCDGDPRYAGLRPEDVPRTESLEDTVVRVVPCWRDSISPLLAAGERVLVVAHGNSLRALVKHLEGIGDDEIAALEIPTGVPLIYRLDGDLRPVSRGYLEHPVAVHPAVTPPAALTGTS